MNGYSAESPPGSGARAAAQQALSETLRRKRPLDAGLEQAISSRGLAERDGAFARAIANETMRRFGQLDDLVRQFVPRAPQPHRAGASLEILLAGACELLFLGVPAHAAVDGANRLAASDSKAVHFKPLINAALRRIAREGPSLVRDQDACRLNTPDWLWLRWCEAYGEETVHAFARVHAAMPPLDLAFTRTSEFSSPARGGGAAEGGGGSNPAKGTMPTGSELPGGMLRLENAGNVTGLPGFGEGEFWVQDFAASLPVCLFGDLRGRRAIDLCAAPGGKTAQLVSAGAEVTAVDRDPGRVARLQENLHRLRLDARIVRSDVRDFSPDLATECVLLDAPCTSTGTIRRHPELPWIKSAADVMASAEAASALLDAAAEMVARSGTLVFAVCSLEVEEGPEQIEHFLRRNADFRRQRVEPSEVFGLGECINAQGDLRSLPCHLAESGGMDGFYAARLARVS
jgi:16S rRNA (cytosine967-C5)-methyltransferase